LSIPGQGRRAQSGQGPRDPGAPTPPTDVDLPRAS